MASTTTASSSPLKPQTVAVNAGNALSTSSPPSVVVIGEPKKTLPSTDTERDTLRSRVRVYLMMVVNAHLITLKGGGVEEEKDRDMDAVVVCDCPTVCGGVSRVFDTVIVPLEAMLHGTWMRFNVRQGIQHGTRDRLGDYMHFIIALMSEKRGCIATLTVEHVTRRCTNMADGNAYMEAADARFREELDSIAGGDAKPSMASCKRCRKNAIVKTYRYRLCLSLCKCFSVCTARFHKTVTNSDPFVSTGKFDIKFRTVVAMRVHLR
jgi:hypothetical protein